MPHSFDFDGLESDLFILQHTAYGSREFCEKFDLKSDCYGGDYEWWEYKGILKTHVSNKIIEAAIKVRMLQDFAKHVSDDIDLKTIDADCRSGLSIGAFKCLPTLLTLRESCNKIVHATEARMQWVNSKTKSEVEYWSGGYELLGDFQSKKWHVDLSIPEWCTSMIRFNKTIQESLDWQHVEKYDV